MLKLKYKKIKTEDYLSSIERKFKILILISLPWSKISIENFKTLIERSKLK